MVINDISRNASCRDDSPNLCWNGDFPEAAGCGSIPRVKITASPGWRAGLLILWSAVISKIQGIFNTKGYRLRHIEIWIWIYLSRVPVIVIAIPAFLLLPIASQDWLCTTGTWAWSNGSGWARRRRRLLLQGRVWVQSCGKKEVFHWQEGQLEWWLLGQLFWGKGNAFYVEPTSHLKNAVPAWG